MNQVVVKSKICPSVSSVDIETNKAWWHGAIIYQVYPRSLYDSNNDGVGDLPGVTQKLNYIASLGVDAIWVSPFFKSPMKDFGYDISDFRDVDPLFGNLKDFDELVEKAHTLGLKVIIDQVLSHTSDQHEWFKESRHSRTNDKADWYVWADAKADGSPPNNWLSIFGGSAWQWEPQRKQYYLHNFLTSQPDLNYHCDTLRQQMLKEVEFWLKRNVDGFRLDAINFCYHDKQLRDNPPKPKEERKGRGFSSDNPYAAQYHYYDNTQTENLLFLESLRNLLNQYPGTVSLGEINSENSLQTMAEYTRENKRLHMGYSFELLADEFSAKYIQHTIQALEAGLDDGWPCWAISNHDVERVASRWGKDRQTKPLAKMLLALTASLRGTICTYQGEELGLTEATIQQHELQDPFGIEFWPDFKGRDGCRTPMPWQQQQSHAGFSSTTPWLPIAHEHKQHAVDIQEADKNSVLMFYRNFLTWRKTQECLIHGDITFISASNELLVFKRYYKSQCLIACFNLAKTTQMYPLPDNAILIESPKAILCASINNKQVSIPTLGFCYLKQI